jgi:hypothetical protein
MIAIQGGGEIEFIELPQVAARIGCNPVTVRRRLRRQGIPLWLDPADHRRRLVRREDLDGLLQPRPAQSRSETAVSAA